MQTTCTRKHHGVAAFYTATSKTPWLARTVSPSPSSLPVPVLGLDAATAAASNSSTAPHRAAKAFPQPPALPLSRGRLPCAQLRQ